MPARPMGGPGVGIDLRLRSQLERTTSRWEGRWRPFPPREPIGYSYPVMAEPRPIVREILRLAEEVSGSPVVIQEDHQSRLPGSLRIARGGAPAHIITYNPTLAPCPDYVIAFQCGFILRFFASPPEHRLDLAGGPVGRRIVQQLLTGPDGPARKMNLRPDVIEGLRDQLFNGLMTQLRSIPVGLRVDSWMLEHHPDLIDLQRAEVIRQLQENLATLGPDVKKIAPTKVYKASLSMNAAVAAFWAHRWGEDSLLVPYASAGFRKVAADLLDLLGRVDTDATHDRELIDGWGAALGLTTWYEWIPYDSGVRG